MFFWVKLRKKMDLAGKKIDTDFKHVSKLEKVAVFGKDKHHEKTWAKLADPFMKADVKYFPLEEKVIAEDWIKE